MNDNDLARRILLNSIEAIEQGIVSRRLDVQECAARAGKLAVAIAEMEAQAQELRASLLLFDDR
jgi:hypothetical protein